MYSSYEQFSGDKAKEPRKVWDNPQALALIDQAEKTSDQGVRRKLFDSLHQMVLDDVPLILLYNGVTVWGYNTRVKGFSPWEGKPRLWDVRVGG